MKLHTISISILISLFALSTAINFQACKSSDAETKTVQSEINSLIPPVFERKGELAKTEEWQRTKEKVNQLTQLISSNPSDIKPRIQLATIYIAEARITGEHPYYYPAILKILDAVLQLEPDNFEGLVLKASVKLSQHQFAEAKIIGEKAMEINPANAYVYGVLVDANVELGNYHQAIIMSDKMQALKPSLESYSRASYLREIHGDYAGAIEAMTLAVQAGLPGSEPRSWAENTLAYLYLKTGQDDKAESTYLSILETRPGYAFAMKGLADVYVTRRNYNEALSILENAGQVLPEFSFYEKIGDIYILKGEKEKAAKTYNDVLGMLKEDEESGHTVNLELARIYTKIGNYQQARNLALKEYQLRPSNIDVNKSLAWINYKAGDIAKAKFYLSAAFATSSKDPDFLVKAGQIEKALGNKKKASKLMAEAKKVNPRPHSSVDL
jgi:tetratricopeptide (TPR) repeat protein